MKLLAIDTSTDITLLGLDLDGRLVDGSMRAGRSHSRGILPAIESLLAEGDLGLRDLDGIVFGKGPGSFTGLRIAAGVVQGLAYGLNLPVAPVSSLACCAQRFAADDGSAAGRMVAVALQARLSEVYFGTFHIEGGIALGNQDEQVVDASAVPACQPGNWIGVGDGWKFRAELEEAMGVAMARVEPNAALSAEHLMAQGRHVFASGLAVTAMEALPEYLREEVASKPTDKPKNNSAGNSASNPTNNSTNHPANNPTANSEDNPTNNPRND